MINMDKPEYQELAKRIRWYYDQGFNWATSEWFAKASLNWPGAQPVPYRREYWHYGGSLT